MFSMCYDLRPKKHMTLSTTHHKTDPFCSTGRSKQNKHIKKETRRTYFGFNQFSFLSCFNIIPLFRITNV
jgi:hypothetical protein